MDAWGAQSAAGTLRLSLGSIAWADVTYIDGVRVGATGRLPSRLPSRPGGAESRDADTAAAAAAAPQECGSELAFRSYPLPTRLPLDAGREHTLSVHVYNPYGLQAPGGLYDAGARSAGPLSDGPQSECTLSDGNPRLP